MLTKIVIITNLIFVLFMAIFEWRKPQSVIFWSFAIFLFSIFGFILYVVLGNGLKFKSKKLILKKQKSEKNYLKCLKWYKEYHKEINLKTGITRQQTILINYLKNKLNINLWRNNKLKILNTPEEFINDFIQDLKKATKTINLEFYIFANDKTGWLISNILLQKAKEGVKVKILYDAIGSRGGHKMWDKLSQGGIEVCSFLPSWFKMINFRINYRNHRKIAIIDGKISYTGGINLRDDHFGANERLCPWRDVQIKMEGSATYSLQNVFFNDWCFVKKTKISKNEIGFYFPEFAQVGNNYIAVASSGPEDEKNKIKKIYLKIISNAKKYICIQTPYFVISKDLKTALIDATRRGVVVNIMLPQKPDKKFVYQCSLKCVKELMPFANVFLYNGFIHAKTLLTESVLSIGSCNFDYRSFNLNFETTALLFDNENISKYNKIINNDIANSNVLNNKELKKRYNKNPIIRLICLFISRLA